MIILLYSIHIILICQISGFYLTKCISPQKFDKFRANIQYVTTKPATINPS